MCTPVFGNDIWWHLKTGEYILAEMDLPATSLFAYPCLENRWVDSHWLYQIWQYFLWSWGGIKALIVSNSLVIVLSMSAAILPCMRRREWLWAAFLLLVASFIFNQRSLVRPEIYSYLFFSVYLLILEQHRSNPKNLYILPVLQLLWVNSQGIYLFGIAILGIYAVEDLRQNGPLWTPLMKAAVASVLVCFLHPYGIEGTLYPFRLWAVLGTPVWKREITEFWPLWSVRFAFPVALSLFFFLLFPLFLALAGRKNFPLRYLVLYAVFLVPAVSAVRNLPFVTLVSLMIASRASDYGMVVEWRPSLKATMGCLLILNTGILAALLISQNYYPCFRDARHFGMDGIESSRYPVKTVDYLIEHDLAGNIFNYLDDGGYLIWRLFPGHLVFIDTRIDPIVMGEEHFNRYLRMCRDRDYFEKMADHYDIRLVILRPTARHHQWLMSSVFRMRLVAQQSRIILQYDASARWQPIFVDLEENSILLQRKE